MSFNRRKTLRESNRELREAPPRTCRQCTGPVPPPRRTFCTDECVHEWKLRSDGSYLREHTYRRDLGRCNECKVDTRLQKIQLEDLLKRCGGDQKAPEYVALLKSLSLTASEARKSLWQADHVRPVAHGGGECGLSNIQTLCTKCHKKKTRGQATYRAKPAAIKPHKVPALTGLDSFRGVGVRGRFDD